MWINTINKTKKMMLNNMIYDKNDKVVLVLIITQQFDYPSGRYLQQWRPSRTCHFLSQERKIWQSSTPPSTRTYPPRPASVQTLMAPRAGSPTSWTPYGGQGSGVRGYRAGSGRTWRRLVYSGQCLRGWGKSSWWLLGDLSVCIHKRLAKKIQRELKRQLHV